MRKKSKMITARQFAEMHATPYTTVATWLQRELIPGAEKQELPYGGYVWMVPQDAPIPELKPGPKIFGERLEAIGTEILDELSDQYAEFVVHDRAQDSNDRDLTFTAHSGQEKTVRVIRRAGQSDDEVKEQIRAQLTAAGDHEPTKPRRKASKRSPAKKANVTRSAKKEKKGKKGPPFF
jgi:hypothetical protein